MEAKSIPFGRGFLGLMALVIGRLEAVNNSMAYGCTSLAHLPIQLLVDNMTSFRSGFAQISSSSASVLTTGGTRAAARTLCS